MRRTDCPTANFSTVTGLAMMVRQYTRADAPREVPDRDTRSTMNDQRRLAIGCAVLVMALLAGGLLDRPAASGPFMAYHGMRALGVSTNPISIAVPGGERGPVVLDMATGIVARGKLVQARKTNQPIPAGWALDRDGNPTTDPQAALIPLPLGGPKGSGLSLMIELITSLLVSNPIITQALESTTDGQRHRQNGLVLAIDLGRFGDPSVFRAEVDRVIAALKALPRAPGVVEILMPGERGARALAAHTRDGIPLPRPIVEELRGVAARFGLPAFPSAL